MLYSIEGNKGGFPAPVGVFDYVLSRIDKLLGFGSVPMEETDVRQHMWILVPVGSKFCLSVTSDDDDGEFNVQARHSTNELWSHEELVPGPKCKKVESDQTVDLFGENFSGDETTLTVNARVTTPGGASHPADFDGSVILSPKSGLRPLVTFTITIA